MTKSSKLEKKAEKKSADSKGDKASSKKVAAKSDKASSKKVDAKRDKKAATVAVVEKRSKAAKAVTEKVAKKVTKPVKVSAKAAVAAAEGDDTKAARKMSNDRKFFRNFHKTQRASKKQYLMSHSRTHRLVKSTTARMAEKIAYATITDFPSRTAAGDATRLYLSAKAEYTTDVAAAHIFGSVINNANGIAGQRGASQISLADVHAALLNDQRLAPIAQTISAAKLQRHLAREWINGGKSLRGPKLTAKVEELRGYVLPKYTA